MRLCAPSATAAPAKLRPQERPKPSSPPVLCLELCLQVSHHDSQSLAGQSHTGMDVRSLCSGAAVSACAGSHGGLAMDRVATLSACGGSMGGGSWLKPPLEVHRREMR